ncbi:MAG: four helix bundle protein [Planctomycetes bacterium]|nr:four helix bundle protein [Planctomycetota bacterium]
MTHFTELRVFKEARINIQDIARICESSRGFGDIHNQMKRAAVSVVSNIAEGAGSGTQKQNVRFLGIARGSNHELLAQVLILSDLKIIEADAAIIGRINYVGKMLTKLIQCLK